MNTVAKGNTFELRFLNIVRYMLKEQTMKVILDSGEEWTVPPYAETTNKKTYKYPWGKNVIIDIAVEIKANNKTDVVLIECKNYDSTIEVEKILAFARKTEDLKAVKGVFVTTSRFQDGAIQAAKYHNIALIRVNDDDVVTWDLHRLGSALDISYYNLAEQLKSERIRGEAIIIDKSQSYTSVVECLMKIFKIDTPYEKNLQYLSEETIKNKANDFIGVHQSIGVDTPLILGQALNNNIIVDISSDCNGMMGCCNFKNRWIAVNRNLLKDQHRYRFTLAHEIGHIILQSDMLKNIMSGADDSDKQINLGISSTDWRGRLEYQANLFASYLLIPDIPFQNIFFEMKTHKGYKLIEPLYLDEQACNKKDCLIIITALSQLFNVSKEVIYIKLVKKKLLNDIRPKNNILGKSINL